MNKTKKAIFLDFIARLERFTSEQKKVQEAIEVIAPGAVCEHGNEFVDDYIALMESYLGITNNDISWFVFENDFGRKGYSCWLYGKEYKINSAEDMWLWIIKCQENESK